jgi:lipopolysaccharide biosynthesis glycosyltransferase
MIILSAADEHFAPHFATMLHSAWTHNPSAHFHLLDVGIEQNTLSKLIGFARWHGINFNVIKVETPLLDGLPTTKAWSKAIYARLFIADLLPEAERVIYLDADCIVLSSLTELWDLDMGEVAVAGVHDPFGRSHSGLDKYINSGVMIMNLTAWRCGSVGARALAFIQDFKPRAPDQTAINVICAGAGGIHYIDERWNFMLGAAWRKPTVWIEPHIIHCTGYAKPWLFSDVQFAPLYVHHREQTPFPLLARPRRRGTIRFLLNLLIGRRKYWHRLITARRASEFVYDYLSRRTAFGRQTMRASTHGCGGLLNPNSLARSKSP